MRRSPAGQRARTPWSSPEVYRITDEHAARLSALWGFNVPASRGMTAPEMIDAAQHDDYHLACARTTTDIAPDADADD